MKTKLLPSTLILLTFSFSVFSSCQKNSGADNTIAAANNKQKETAMTAEQIPTNFCTDDIKKLAKQFVDTQKLTAKLSDKLKQNPKSSDLNAQLQEKSETLVEYCRLIEDKFNQEKIDSCLYNEKNLKNIMSKKNYTQVCTNIRAWAKFSSDKDSKKPDAVIISEDAKVLFSDKTKNEIYFIADQEIQSGQNNLQQKVASGSKACLITTNISELADDGKFEYFADMNDPDSNQKLGFDFNGYRSVIALKDSNHVMHSMLCLNLKISAENNKIAALQKIFGTKITLIEKTSPKENIKSRSAEAELANAQATLNKEIVPEPTETTKMPDESAAAKQTAKAASAASNEKTITEVKVALNEVLEKTGTEVNKITDHAIGKLKAEALDTIDKSIDKAGESITKAIIKGSKKVWKELIVDPIIEPIKRPFIATGEYLSETYQAAKEKTVAAYEAVKSWF